MIALTNFGDPAVLLPIAFVLFLWLMHLPKKRAALWWLVALALCVAVTAFLKIDLYPCPQSAQLRNPSGHVSLSVLVYGAIATLIAAQFGHRQRLAAIGGIAALVIAIALSRILLDAHTALEVVFGLGIGLGSLAAFATHYRPQPAAKFPLRRLLLVTLAVMVIFHGDTLYAEDFLHHLNDYMGLEPIACL